MIYWFSGAQLVAAVAARCAFSLRGWQWTLKHTLFCILIPLLCLLVWTALWWFQILAAVRLPTPWLDDSPSAPERVFICLPPLAMTWLLFFVFRRSLRHHDNAA
jgi:hypothetical protein